MEIKTEGIVLSSRDYKENDRLVTLLTPEYGKLTFSARGVKKANAKLRFAVQPFAFCEYVLAEKGGRFTLVSASSHESFFGLADPDRYYPACVMTELASIVTKESSPTYFLSLARHLLKAQEEDPKETLVSFLLDTMEECGMPIDAGECAFCQKKIVGKVFFHFPTGQFSCLACHQGTPVSIETYHLIKKLKGLPFEECEKEDTSLRAIRLLKEYFSYKTELNVQSLNEYIRQLRN